MEQSTSERVTRFISTPTDRFIHIHTTGRHFLSAPPSSVYGNQFTPVKQNDVQSLMMIQMDLAELYVRSGI